MAKTSVLNKWNQVWDAPSVFVANGAAKTLAACQIHYLSTWPRAASYTLSELKKQII